MNKRLSIVLIFLMVPSLAQSEWFDWLWKYSPDRKGIEEELLVLRYRKFLEEAYEQEKEETKVFILHYKQYLRNVEELHKRKENTNAVNKAFVNYVIEFQMNHRASSGIKIIRNYNHHNQLTHYTLQFPKDFIVDEHA